LPEPARAAASAGAAAGGDQRIALSPGQEAEREQTMRERVAETGLPLVYAHLVGGQDEVVFEGRSFA
jgi:NAD+ synthase (glutamine-hydrolysing)